MVLAVKNLKVRPDILFVDAEKLGRTGNGTNLHSKG